MTKSARVMCFKNYCQQTLEKYVIGNMAFGGNWIDAISFEHNLFQFFPSITQSNGLKFCWCWFPYPSYISIQDVRDDFSPPPSLSLSISYFLSHYPFLSLFCFVWLRHEHRKRCRKLSHLFRFFFCKLSLVVISFQVAVFISTLFETRIA